MNTRVGETLAQLVPKQTRVGRSVLTPVAEEDPPTTSRAPSTSPGKQVTTTSLPDDKDPGKTSGA
jgi:hypothetical protein